MESRSERAKELFLEGFNCSQSVFAAFADLFNMDECKRIMKKLDSVDIDVFINNAGFGYCGETLTIEAETELNMIDLNIKSVHILTKLFAEAGCIKLHFSGVNGHLIMMATIERE